MWPAHLARSWTWLGSWLDHVSQTSHHLDPEFLTSVVRNTPHYNKSSGLALSTLDYLSSLCMSEDVSGVNLAASMDSSQRPEALWIASALHGFDPCSSTPVPKRRATIEPEAKTSPADAENEQLSETVHRCDLKVVRTVGTYKPRDPALTGIDGHVFAAAINAGEGGTWAK